MPQSIGTLMRQLRREQNKTQTELGGAAFSKSYVSAVESDKLTPSKEALKHFALGLGKPEEYFLTITNPENGKALPSLPAMTSVLGQDVTAQEKVTLLAAFLDQPDYTEIQTLETFFALDPAFLEQLDFPDQAHYYFFQGVLLQRKKAYTPALESLEHALARENHHEHRAAILHEISRCYLQMHSPQMAWPYAQRAHQALERATSFPVLSSLPFRIELHSGYVCLALGLYQYALEHFEEARAHLTSRHPMHYAGQLYQGLGYCAYALAYQQASTTDEYNQQVEHFYQQALTYLLQSLTIVQMAGDTKETNNVCLMLATLKLDWSIWRARCYHQDKRASQPARGLGLTGLSSLLDEASEQCRQVLASLQEMKTAGEEAFHAQTRIIYLALALLIRITVQRALLAYEQGYDNTCQRERALACLLCQQTLDSCQEKDMLTGLVWNVANLTEQTLPSLFAALPRFPEAAAQSTETQVWPDQASLAESWFAAGEVAEMLGKTATSADFIRDCHNSADYHFPRALTHLKASQIKHPDASGYLARAYQRYGTLLEERLLDEKGEEHETDQVAHALLILWKQQLQTHDKEKIWFP